MTLQLYLRKPLVRAAVIVALALGVMMSDEGCSGPSSPDGGWRSMPASEGQNWPVTH